MTVSFIPLATLQKMLLLCFCQKREGRENFKKSSKLKKTNDMTSVGEKAQQ
jgi:hypothetical protein